MKRQETDKLLQNAQALKDDILEMESIDISRAFQRVQHQIKKRYRKLWMNRLTRVAAILSIPLLISTMALGYLHFSQPEIPIQYAEVTAAPGSVIRYELPDKSVVWLNAGTTLRYPTRFQSEHREVNLNGEAYFEVTAHPEHPFYVHTLNGPTVYVYGTKFNVSAYEEDTTVNTVLEQGKVNVQLPTQEETVLRPSEQLIYNKNNGNWSKSEVDVYEKVAWKDGKLIFRNATLPEIFQKLSRHFNVEIVLNNSKLQKNRYRATFRQETLSQIMDYLSQSTDMKWKIEQAIQQEDATRTPTKIIVDLYE